MIKGETKIKASFERQQLSFKTSIILTNVLGNNEIMLQTPINKDLMRQAKFHESPIETLQERSI